MEAEAYGSVWKHMEAYGSVWKRMEAFGSVWKRMEAYGSMWKCTGVDSPGYDLQRTGFESEVKGSDEVLKASCRLKSKGLAVRSKPTNWFEA
jgi:hypothetical protein